MQSHGVHNLPNFDTPVIVAGKSINNVDLPG